MAKEAAEASGNRAMRELDPRDRPFGVNKPPLRRPPPPWTSSLGTFRRGNPRKHEERLSSRAETLPTHRQRRERRTPHAAGIPPLPEHLMLVADALEVNLVAETNGRDPFDNAIPADMIQEDETLPMRLSARRTGIHVGCFYQICGETADWIRPLGSCRFSFYPAFLPIWSRLAPTKFSVRKVFALTLMTSPHWGDS